MINNLNGEENQPKYLVVTLTAVESQMIGTAYTVNMYTIVQ